MTIRPGFSIRYVDRSGVEHLWFVISDVDRHPDEVLIVNISTFEQGKDRACLLKSGDHPFINRESCVMYEEALLWSKPELESKLAAGVITPAEPVNAATLLKIWDGAYATTRLIGKHKRLLVEQGLI